MIKGTAAKEHSYISTPLLPSVHRFSHIPYVYLNFGARHRCLGSEPIGEQNVAGPEKSEMCEGRRRMDVA
jgi:hypothetical protein